MHFVLCLTYYLVCICFIYTGLWQNTINIVGKYKRLTSFLSLNKLYFWKCIQVQREQQDSKSILYNDSTQNRQRCAHISPHIDASVEEVRSVSAAANISAQD